VTTRRLVVWTLQVFAGLALILWAVATRYGVETAAGVGGAALLLGALLERRGWRPGRNG
jgi:hypothetical protein